MYSGRGGPTRWSSIDLVFGVWSGVNYPLVRIDFSVAKKPRSVRVGIIVMEFQRGTAMGIGDLV